MNMLRFTASLILLSLLSPAIRAQDDNLLDLLGEEKVKEPVIASFKGTRLINFHTLEVPGRNTLDFRISHRFGPFNSGWYDFFGLDGGASIRLGFEYSPDGRLCVGVGRTSYEKMLDGFLKYRLLRQSTGGGSPVSVTIFTSMFATMQKDPDKDLNGFDKYGTFSNRLSYAHQVIVGRKFSERFSLQIAPVYVHYNLVDKISDKNDALVVTAATRFKFTKRMAITLEYGYRPIGYSRTKYYDSLGIGWDIETGGHVFQLFVTNSFGLLENQFLTHTNSSWKDMGIRLGFNISRVFSL